MLMTNLSTWRSWLWVAPLALVCGLAGRAPAQSKSEPQPPREILPDSLDLGFESADEAVVLDLVEGLGSPQFQVREAAAARLTELGPAAFRTLARAYRDVGDFETRLRIREIVRDRYLWHVLFSKKGFLGIQFSEIPPDPRNQRLPEHAAPISVQAVVAGLPASAGGVLPGDLIVGVNGEMLIDDPEQAEFRDMIQDAGAGVEVVLSILRGDQPVELTVTLIARPIEQYRTPELLEEMQAAVQRFGVWWAENFAFDEARPERAPSSTIFELPE